MPELREEFMIQEMSKETGRRHDLMSGDGMGSKVRVDVFIPAVNSGASDGGQGGNRLRQTVTWRGEW